MFENKDAESLKRYHGMYLETKNKLEEIFKVFNIPSSEPLIQSLMDWATDCPVGGFWSKKDFEFFRKSQQTEPKPENVIG